MFPISLIMVLICLLVGHISVGAKTLFCPTVLALWGNLPPLPHGGAALADLAWCTMVDPMQPDQPSKFVWCLGTFQALWCKAIQLKIWFWQTWTLRRYLLHILSFYIENSKNSSRISPQKMIFHFLTFFNIRGIIAHCVAPCNPFHLT